MKSMRQEIFSGVFFTAIAKYSNLVVSLAVSAILARLLLPEQFGVVAIAMVTITFLNLIADIGLFPAVVQYRELEKSELDVLFSISCYIGLALSLVLFFGSYYISAYYEQPLLEGVIRILSFSLFFSAISVVPNALFYRERMFKFIALRSFGIQVLGGLLSVTAAFYGAGVYALLINPVLSSILIFGLSYAYFPRRFKFRFRVETLSHVFKYSTFQFLFNIINYFSRNADTILIGRYLGMNWLGYYDKAYQLMSLPLQNITQVITPVIHPILSIHKQDRKQLRDANEKLVRLLALIGFPLTVFLYFSASDLIFFLFGNTWAPAVPVFRILSLTVGIQLVLSSSGSIFQASGDTRRLFVCGLTSAILNVSGILFGIFYYQSVVAVAICLTVTFSVNFFVTYWIMYALIFDEFLWRFFSLLIKPVLFSLCFAGLFYAVSIYLLPDGVFHRLIINSVLFAFGLGLFVWYGGYREYIDIFRKK